MGTRTLLICQFDVTDETNVVEIWTQCDLIRPWNDPREDLWADQLCSGSARV